MSINTHTHTHTDIWIGFVCALLHTAMFPWWEWTINRIKLDLVDIVWIEINIHIYFTFISNLEVHNIFLVVWTNHWLSEVASNYNLTYKYLFLNHEYIAFSIFPPLIQNWSHQICQKYMFLITVGRCHSNHGAVFTSLTLLKDNSTGLSLVHWNGTSIFMFRTDHYNISI